MSRWVPERALSHPAFRLWAFLIITALSTGFVLLLLAQNHFIELENQTWDWRVRWTAGRNRPDPRIKLILIDQSSLERRAAEEGQYWPWPRSLYNPVLFFLKQAGAKAVAFDLLFTEDSNFVRDDAKFAEAVGQSVPVVMAVAGRSASLRLDEERLEVFRSRQEETNARDNFAARFLEGLPERDFQSASFPIRELLETAHAFGNVTADADLDKIYRHAFPGAYIRGIPVLSLPFALYSQVEKEEDTAALRDTADDQGRYLVRFFGPAGTFPAYSIDAVIQSWVQLSQGLTPQISPDEFKDAYVLIGTNALGLLDLRPTPFSGEYPGVEFNATVLDNLLQQRFLQKVPLAAATAMSGFLIAVITLSCLFVPTMGLRIVLLGGTFLLAPGAAFLLALQGWWQPLVVPGFGMALAMMLSLLLIYELEGRQRRFLKSAFAYYVSREVIDELVADPAKLSLGGERRELSIFFSDIMGFTGISEAMEPGKLVLFLNRFLSEMTDIVLACGGTVDKYQGDAVIAFWNAPLDLPEHREQAVYAAMRCQQRLDELDGYFREEFGVVLRMRIGINTGFVSVGNFGSNTRFNYTVIGDAANLASRLEGANKLFGTRIMVSDATREGLEERFHWRRIGAVQVLGRQEPVVVYEPLDPRSQAEVIERLDEYHRALEAFERGAFEEAAPLFAQLGSDPVAAEYRRRIDEGRADGPWCPVWVLSGK